ncbi:MAG: helix-turn-helix transcriptional regulator [Chitinophagaceae bacterium]|nr:helix-turn-helix transcriptional regulator [Chitinophagaceae bacterium]
MNLKIQTLSHPPLHWQEVLPPAFPGVRLPGASLKTAIGDFGSVCIQEFRTDLYCIRYSVLNIVQKFILSFSVREKGLFSRLILNGKVHLYLGHTEKRLLKNQFYSHLTPSSPVRIVLEEQTAYHGFDTFFSQALLNETTHDYPALSSSLKASLKYPQWADAEVYEIVHSMLHCTYQQDLRLFYFKSRVCDLLFKYLTLAVNEPGSEDLPSQKELEAALLAESIIRQDIQKHYLIPELAKKVLLNEVRLKAVFKKIFGIGMYEYLVRIRMKKALPLLKEGLSVKEVAAKTGYRPADFTTAFIRFYGFLPGSVKKKH